MKIDGSDGIIRDLWGSLTGLVVIDEFQRRPDLFPILRVLSDRPERPARFLILGSASPMLVSGASESLAGRVRFIEMSGFSSVEVGTETRDRLWLRGGYPGTLSFPLREGMEAVGYTQIPKLALAG